MSVKRCFLKQETLCTHNCAAFVEDTKTSTNCRLLNTLERLVPPPARPIAPAPPAKVKS